MLRLDGLGIFYMSCCHEFVLVHVLADLPTRKEPLETPRDEDDFTLDLRKQYQ